MKAGQRFRGFTRNPFRNYGTLELWNYADYADYWRLPLLCGGIEAMAQTEPVFQNPLKVTLTPICQIDSAREGRYVVRVEGAWLDQPYQ